MFSGHDLSKEHEVEPLRAREAARVIGVSPSTIRHWEQRGLLQLRRGPTSGYRLYDQAVLSRIQAIAPEEVPLEAAKALSPRGE